LHLTDMLLGAQRHKSREHLARRGWYSDDCRFWCLGMASNGQRFIPWQCPPHVRWHAMLDGSRSYGTGIPSTTYH